MKTLPITCLFYLCLALLLTKTRMSLQELDDLTSLTTDGSCKMKNNINTGKTLGSCFFYFFPNKVASDFMPKTAKCKTSYCTCQEYRTHP